MSGYRAKPPKGALLNKGDPLARGLVAAWLFNEGSGLKAYDATGNGNTGTLTNGPTWGSGPFGKALSFTAASSQYADATSAPTFANTAPHSYAAWINLTTNSALRAIVDGSDSGGTQRGTGMWHTAGGKLQLAVKGTFNFINGATTLATGTWYFVTTTWDGTTGTVYVNGVGDGSSAPGVTWPAGNGGVRLGAYRGSTPSNFLNGVIDSPQVYNRALSAAEVRALYADSFRMFRRRWLPVPLKPSAATGNRRRRVICGAAA